MWFAQLLNCLLIVVHLKLTRKLFAWFNEGNILYTGKISPPFYFRPFRLLTWGRIQNWANSIIYKGLCKKISEWANSRLGETVSDLHRAKIRLGKFKAVYSTTIVKIIDMIAEKIVEPTKGIFMWRYIIYLIH